MFNKFYSFFGDVFVIVILYDLVCIVGIWSNVVVVNEIVRYFFKFDNIVKFFLFLILVVNF